MQRRYATKILFLMLTLVLSMPIWAGDPGAADVSADLKKGYEAAKRGYWNEAMARYMNASKNTPGNAEIWSNLGVALEAVGRYAEAGDAYRRALEIDPGNGKIHKNYAFYNEFYMSYIVRPESPDETEAVKRAQENEEQEPDEEDSTISPIDEPIMKGAGDASKL